jgi:hypothetical protein
MSIVSALTLFHVFISLVATVTGVALVRQFIVSGHDKRWAFWFSISIGATLLTSFLFPFKGMTPAIAIGLLCVLIFAPTLYARYRTGLTGVWRPIYVIGVMLLLYFNCLVLIVQSFQKIAPLNAVAPIGDEFPVVFSQGVLLIVALILGTLAMMRFDRKVH